MGLGFEIEGAWAGDRGLGMVIEGAGLGDEVAGLDDRGSWG